MDLKMARIAIIRDGEHHLENEEILRLKAPNHVGGFGESFELGATSSEVLEALLVVTNEEFSNYLESLPAPLKSRLFSACQKLSPMPTELPPTPDVVEGDGDDSEASFGSLDKKGES
jgi:hypothetical protein